MLTSVICSFNSSQDTAFNNVNHIGDAEPEQRQEECITDIVPVLQSCSPESFSPTISPRKCRKCCKMFKNKSALVLHRRKCLSLFNETENGTNAALVSKMNDAETNNTRTRLNENDTETSYRKKCENCRRVYKHRSSFWRHTKRCLMNKDGDGGALSIVGGDKSTAALFRKKCSSCKKVYTHRSSFWKHKKRCKDTLENDDNVKKSNLLSKKCEKCKKVFRNRSSFWRHQRRTCSSLKKCDEKKKGVFFRQCSSCLLGFSSSQSYLRHQNYCKLRSNNWRISCLYADCSAKFLKYSYLITHLQRQHDTSVAVKEFHFTNMEEFKEWKDSEQVNNCMYTIRKSGTQNVKDKQYFYFVCQFDAYYRRKQAKRKTSRRRSIGSVPYVMCPARMFVQASCQGVDVKYIATHNHEVSASNSKWQRLPKSVISFIKRSFECGANPQKVKEMLEEGGQSIAEGETGKKSPPQYVSMQQINQILYKMNKSKMLPVDDESVKAYCNEKSSGIFIFKPKGSPAKIGENLDNVPNANCLFAIGLQTQRQLEEMRSGNGRVVCVDVVDFTEQYQFYVVNFIMPDENGMGCPVVHFITNYLNIETLTALFSNIKRISPEINFSAVLVDDDFPIEDAFLAVFGTCVKCLLCKWYVLRNWKVQLLRKIQDSKLASEIYRILLTLLNIENSSDFQVLQENFITRYWEIESCVTFIDYYTVKYMSRAEMWASCFRNLKHVSNNSFCKEFHTNLKPIISVKKSDGKLSTLINILLDLEEDIFSKKQVIISNDISIEIAATGMEEESSSTRSKFDYFCDEGSHYQGMLISNYLVSVVDSKTWHIRSPHIANEIYTVSRINMSCPFSNRCKPNIKCTSYTCFSLCIHLYHCDCPDQENLCKHIHKIRSDYDREAAYYNNICYEAPKPPDFKLSPLITNNGVSEPDQPNFLRALLENKDGSYSGNCGNSGVKLKQYGSRFSKTVNGVFKNALKNTRNELFKITSKKSRFKLGGRNGSVVITKHKTYPLYIFNELLLPRLKELVNAKPCVQKVLMPQINETLNKLIHTCNMLKPSDIADDGDDDDADDDDGEESSDNDCVSVTPIRQNSVICSLQGRSLYNPDNFLPSRQFTPPIKNVNKLSHPIITINKNPINVINLKSLDCGISNDEVRILSKYNPDFQRGWIYDCIIDAYIYLCCVARENKVIPVESAIAQLVHANSITDCVDMVTNIRGSQITFIPCNPTTNHWILLVLKPMLKQIEVYDPKTIGVQKDVMLQNCLQSWIDFISEPEDKESWVANYPDHTIQQDDNSCGVFVCWFVKQILENKSLTLLFDVHKFREEIYNYIVEDVVEVY